MDEFEITEEHLILLKHSYVSWWNCEYGAPSIDPKRPYGSGSVLESMADILGEKLFEDMHGETHLSKEQGDRLEKLHEDMQIVLQIVLCTQSFSLGKYIKENEYRNRSWTKVVD